MWAADDHFQVLADGRQSHFSLIYRRRTIAILLESLVHSFQLLASADWYLTRPVDRPTWSSDVANEE
jgi:hypothetical protein